MDKLRSHLERAQAGDPNAFEPLIHAYQQKLYAYCYYMLGNRQDAEDAVQEVFIRAYRSMGTYRYDLSFAAWLYKIAGNHCLTLMKRKKRWRFLLPRLDRLGQEKSAEDAYAEKDAAVILELLARLTAEERQLVILHVLEEQSFEEIARCLDLKAATVRKRFERIRKKLGNAKENGEEIGYDARTIRI